MHCQNCHKNFAAIRYAEVVDGEVVEQQLCRECIDQRASEQASGFEFKSPAPFVRKDNEPAKGDTSHYKLMSCGSCNTVLQDIVDTGEVGCRQCYNTFSTEIDSILEGSKEGLVHTGKVPRQDNARAKARADLQVKRHLLKTSLNSERYEEAAVLRDEIKQLESGLNPSLRGGEVS
jgi:protein arginine kinase activator